MLFILLSIFYVLLALLVFYTLKYNDARRNRKINYPHGGESRLSSYKSNV